MRKLWRFRTSHFIQFLVPIIPIVIGKHAQNMCCETRLRSYEVHIEFIQSSAPRKLVQIRGLLGLAQVYRQSNRDV